MAILTVNLFICIPTVLSKLFKPLEASKTVSFYKQTCTDCPGKIFWRSVSFQETWRHRVRKRWRHTDLEVFDVSLKSWRHDSMTSLRFNIWRHLMYDVIIWWRHKYVTLDLMTDVIIRWRQSENEKKNVSLKILLKAPIKKDDISTHFHQNNVLYLFMKLLWSKMLLENVNKY